MPQTSVNLVTKSTSENCGIITHRPNGSWTELQHRTVTGALLVVRELNCNATPYSNYKSELRSVLVSLWLAGSFAKRSLRPPDTLLVGRVSTRFGKAKRWGPLNLEAVVKVGRYDSVTELFPMCTLVGTWFRHRDKPDKVNDPWIIRDRHAETWDLSWTHLA